MNLNGNNETLADTVSERTQSLRMRGLKDEKVLEALIAAENGIAEPKRLKAEVFDKMNHTYRSYTDGMIRVRLDYDFIIDIDVLKTVMLCMLERVPIFHSSFTSNFFNPFWTVCDYDINEVVTSEYAESEAAADEFLLGIIPHCANIQFRCHAVFCGGKTLLCILTNHMCTDGGDIMRIMRSVTANYTAYVESGIPPIAFPTGNRGFGEVYKSFSLKDRIKAKLLISNPSTKDKHRLPFSESRESDSPVIVRRMIPHELVSAACKVGKKYGGSVNDVASAACIYAGYVAEKLDRNKPFEISCAINLRRHIANPEKLGITNYIAFMNCAVPKLDDTETLLKNVIKCNKKNKSDKFLGLHGLSLLRFAYHSMIYAQAQPIIRLFRRDSGLVFSNVGMFKDGELSLCGHTPEDCFMCGGAKNKPCSVLVGCTINGDFSLAVCIKGNDEDRKILEGFFDELETGFKLIAELGETK